MYTGCFIKINKSKEIYKYDSLHNFNNVVKLADKVDEQIQAMAKNMTDAERKLIQCLIRRKV